MIHKVYLTKCKLNLRVNIKSINSKLPPVCSQSLSKGEMSEGTKPAVSGVGVPVSLKTNPKRR